STPSSRSTDNIIALINGFYLDDAAGTFPISQHLYNGSISHTHPTLGDEIYAGLVVVGSVSGTTQVQITQDEAVLTSFWGTGLNADATQSIISRMLIKTHTGGADIDGQKLIVWARELGDTYAEFSVTMGLGNNVAALFTGSDLNYQDSSVTISGWGTTTNTEGYQSLDIKGDGSAQHWYSKWDDATTPYGTAGHKRIYEFTKWSARRGTAQTLYGVNGQRFRGITHKLPYTALTGTFTQNAVVAWGTSFTYTAGTGTVAVGDYFHDTTANSYGKVVWVDTTNHQIIMQKLDSVTWGATDAFQQVGAGTKTFTAASAITGNTNTGGAGIVLADDASANMWIQLISGSAPGSGYLINQRGATNASKHATSGTVVGETVKAEFIGSYTGSAIIGAYGIGITPAQGVAADTLTDLEGTTLNPPNLQSFTVSGLSSAVGQEDRVLVTNASGLAINFSQLTLNTSLTGAAVTSVVVTTAIPSDTPTTGWIRVQTNSGIYKLCPYTSWTGSTFTITSTDFSADNATAPKNVFIGYIDTFPTNPA
ncbi:MAG TPA: hypothetical protein VN108_05445, partial [Marmoricola sp.]|nr:hypothetical protein [Marmoricola sp.]